MKKIVLACGLVWFMALSSVAAVAENEPSGTVEFTGGAVALGIGFTWGNGTLTYEGETYPFSVSGLTVADVGASSITASGNVYNLNRLEDFNGNYAEAGAGVTIAGGGSIATMRNQNGVVIDLTSTSQGLRVTLGAGGVDISLD